MQVNSNAHHATKSKNVNLLVKYKTLKVWYINKIKPSI
jgi:hypothetical protein